MDELDIPLALAAPSFPANRSVMEHGLLSSGGNGTGGSGFIDAVQVFSDGTGRGVKNIPLEEIRRGCRAAAEYIETHNSGGVQVFVADAVTGADIKTIYRAAAGLGKPLVLAGSAALARYAAGDLARYAARNRGREKLEEQAAEAPVLPIGKNDCALLIAGTTRGETAAQITALSRIMPVPIIRFRVDMVEDGRSEDAVCEACHEAAEQMRNKTRLCIVAVESMFRAEIPPGGADRKQVEGDKTGEAISRALGNLTRKLLDDFQFSVIISTGGDTSLGICRRLEIGGIEPLAEIRPGIPIGKIAGGIYKGRYIITKSGRFGDRETLLEIMDYVGITKKTERKEEQ
jgi:uncharacterized protein YgbK (DUF1537 family)